MSKGFFTPREIVRYVNAAFSTVSVDHLQRSITGLSGLRSSLAREDAYSLVLQDEAHCYIAGRDEDLSTEVVDGAGGFTLRRPLPRLRLPPDIRAGLLRFVDGILSALHLMLVRVLTALTKLPDALAFVLELLIVALRYGFRHEPGDGFSLPSCRSGTYTGS